MPAQKTEKAESREKGLILKKNHKNQGQETRIVLEFKTAWESLFANNKNSIKGQNRGASGERKRRRGGVEYSDCSQHHVS